MSDNKSLLIDLKAGKNCSGEAAIEIEYLNGEIESLQSQVSELEEQLEKQRETNALLCRDLDESQRSNDSLREQLCRGNTSPKKGVVMQYKFRGKRVDNGEWIFGSLLSGGKNGPLIVTWDSEHEDVFYSSYSAFVDPETIGQFTGYTDNNEVEIYVGDYLKTRFNLKHLVEDIRDCHRTNTAIYDGIVGYSKDCEVVGTIHDKAEEAV